MTLIVNKVSKHCKFEKHGGRVDLTYCGLTEGTEVDLFQDGSISYSKGSIFKVSLGFSAKIPDGYEAIISARSSLRKKFGVMLTNGIGVIDQDYCGPEDIWMAEFIAVEDGQMELGDRIVQFKLEKVEDFEITEGEVNGKNRGGFGSTGK